MLHAGRKYLLDRHRPMRDPLFEGIAQKSLQRLAVRFDSVRPEVRSEHVARAPGIVGIPRQWKVRDHHVLDARNAAILCFLKSAVKVDRHPGMALVEWPLDRNEMHD